MIKSNIFSGLTVGIIALPLSMALAIATGVPPQLGLYTAIVAGILAAIWVNIGIRQFLTGRIYD